MLGLSQAMQYVVFGAAILAGMIVRATASPPARQGAPAPESEGALRRRQIAPARREEGSGGDDSRGVNARAKSRHALLQRRGEGSRRWIYERSPYETFLASDGADSGRARVRRGRLRRGRGSGGAAARRAGRAARRSPRSRLRARGAARRDGRDRRDPPAGSHGAGRVRRDLQRRPGGDREGALRSDAAAERSGGPAGRARRVRPGRRPGGLRTWRSSAGRTTAATRAPAAI